MTDPLNPDRRVLAEALAAGGHLCALDDLWAVTRPGIVLQIGGPPTGRTRFFGDPELPPSLPWPTHGDCAMWDPLPLVPASAPCRFVAQIDLSDLGGPGFPVLEGLLSIFVFWECDMYGSAGVVVHHFPSDTVLAVRPHPECDASNERIEPCGVSLQRVTMLPDGYGGPWAAVAERHRAAWDIAKATLPAPVHGAFGHLQATSGYDPTPTAEHHRLLVIPCDDDGTLHVHLALHQDALAAGQLTAPKLVWVDFDGL